VDLYLCDPEPSRLEPAKDLGGLCDTTDSFERMLGWELDGLIIATAETFHVQQGIEACRRRIPILLEKPIAENARQGQALFATAKEVGANVLVGYLLRYASFMRLAKNLLEQGLIGTPVSFQVMLGSYETLTRAKSRFSPSDLNRLFGDYSHEWDYIDWLLGPVRTVVARSRQAGNLELTQNPNVVESILELKNGITGTVHLDYVRHPSARHFTVVGDRGTLEADAQQGLVVARLHSENFSRMYPCNEHRDAIMERQRDHFIEVIHGTEQPLVSLEEGLRAVRVADALILSCATERWQPVASLSQ
jgi:D-apiose dehydrogenase